VGVMKKILLVLWSALLLNLLFAELILAQVVTRFPYENSLTTGTDTKPPLGINVSSISARRPYFDERGIFLTGDVKQQFRFISLDATFDSSNGIEVEFEYQMYNGVKFLGVNGDGISFFLYDATAHPIRIGDKGASLGYGYGEGNGLLRAYLGIGLDEFGSFKRTDGWMKGIPSSLLKGNATSDVTLRGAMGANQGTGYPVLITRSTKSAGVNNNYILNPVTGNYDQLEATTPKNSFALRPLDTEKGAAAYRKVFISLLPNKLGGYNVTVKIKNGERTTTIIDNYHYPTTLKYIEDQTWQLKTLNTNPPSQFRMGFAGSTGEASQSQVIKNLVVTLPFLPVPKEDVIQTFCAGYGAGLNPFANDVFYNGHLYDQPHGENSDAFVDYSSFLFVDDTGKILGTDSYVDKGKGIWFFDSKSGLVNFKPFLGFEGTSKVYYSAKGTASQGGPFKQENYRSNPVSITASVINCHGIGNPHISSKSAHKGIK